MARQRRRHSTGFGYIGFGNNQSVFNQNTTKAFSSLKEKLDNETFLHHNVHFLHKKLTKAEKEAIKARIRKQEKIRTKKTIALFIILAIPIFFFVKFFFDKLASNL
ncbi:hypothetical protein [Algibacter pectinivorans]|uniref:Uncharacterized protein n=1 Tax=Algibacter pectinivorans TaxID=870482 RepID=A0A1I1QV59_9FLAO|nr:hypothetical protein [Algibacter pectinivorans]SFD25887.1 hypothetical protein SAMN04487987_107197 [Algibacter pectinivorans]